MSDIQSIKVLLYNEPVGTISHLPGDKNIFTFDESYVQSASRPTLSLSFKDTFGGLITNVGITRTRLPPFFANLLPEGTMREYLANRAQIHPNHEFSLLRTLGEDLPGALTIQSVDNNERPIFPNLSKKRSDKKKDLSMRFSLAGLQLKFSAIEKVGHGWVIPANGVGGKWIIKLPHSTFQRIPENEYTMMELARRVGIDVPETALHPIKQLEGLPKELARIGSHVFAIKRFDRTEGGGAVHIEDFAQVFGVYPEKKYKNASYRNIAEVIWRECGEPGIVEFMRRFVFNALVGNGDMHLKNWSLIYKEKNKPMLSPAYDFVSTILYLPEDRLALNFVDNKDFGSLSLNQIKRFAAKAGLPEKLVVDTTLETIEAFSNAWNLVKEFPLHEDVRKTIANHLKTIPLWVR